MSKKGKIKNGKNKALHTNLLKQKKDKKREKEDARKARLKAIIKSAKEE